MDQNRRWNSVTNRNRNYQTCKDGYNEMLNEIQYGGKSI